jgi:hypothetical protein
MVPLGIITMVTGAIRVAGPRMARSFIGRARENRALAEIQLMSSTSGEVCEMFNGKSIVRAMGTPKISQFLIFPDIYNTLENRFKDFDKPCAGPPKNARSPENAESPEDAELLKEATPPKDTSCGIHSVLTAVEAEEGVRDTVLMECTRTLVS